MLRIIWGIFIFGAGTTFLIEYSQLEPIPAPGFDEKTTRHFEYVADVCKAAPRSTECEAMRWRIAKFYGVRYRPLEVETPNSIFERDTFEPQESQVAVYGDSDIGQMKFGFWNRIFGQ